MVSLEFLRVEVMDGLKRVGAEFFEATETDQVNAIFNRVSRSSVVSFPRLKRLQFGYNEKWKEWEGYSCLHSLEFYECPILETLPELLQMIPSQSLSILSVR
ncbi:hypothetical protein TorRG33x02_045970 [Trema orientale]|uniref:LRR domain containing protein n=1 Tax=Trema orientale TaxID=63057 RepID=A0A2P5FNW0_TREOI|nr:hypothetical protein TorRG33x02_045970 [Trema orientale]